METDIHFNQNAMRKVIVAINMMPDGNCDHKALMADDENINERIILTLIKNKNL